MKILFTALTIMLVFSGVALADKLTPEELTVLACGNWNGGKLLDNHFGQINVNQVPYSYSTMLFSQKAAERLTSKYGTFDTATANNAFGFGVKQGANYQSITNTYYTAMQKMTEEDAKSLYVIVASQESEPVGSPLHNLPNGLTLFTLGSLCEPTAELNIFRFFHFANDLTKDSWSTTAVYKQLWMDLVNNDADGFVKTVRANANAEAKKAIENWCTEHNF